MKDHIKDSLKLPLCKMVKKNIEQAWMENADSESEWKKHTSLLLEKWSGANSLLHDFWGWKEIRMGKKGSFDLLNWIQDIFPNAKIIILRRDFGDVLKSALKLQDLFKDYGQNVAQIEMSFRKQENTLSSYANNGKRNVYQIFYDDILKDSFPDYFFQLTGIPMSQEGWSEQVAIKLH
jgi:hypothetical protein